MNGQVRAWMYLNSEAEADDWISMLVQYIAKLNQESPFEGISPVAGTRYQQIEERIPQYALGDAIALNLSTAMEHLSTVGYLLREAHYFPPFSLYLSLIHI